MPVCVCVCVWPVCWRSMDDFPMVPMTELGVDCADRWPICWIVIKTTTSNLSTHFPSLSQPNFVLILCPPCLLLQRCRQSGLPACVTRACLVLPCSPGPMINKIKILDLARPSHVPCLELCSDLTLAAVGCSSETRKARLKDEMR